jgi:hypothetical protein
MISQALVEGLTDGIHIVSDARKNFTVAGFVEIVEGQAVDLLRNIAA